MKQNSPEKLDDEVCGQFQEHYRLVCRANINRQSGLRGKDHGHFQEISPVQTAFLQDPPRRGRFLISRGVQHDRVLRSCTSLDARATETLTVYG